MRMKELKVETLEIIFLMLCLGEARWLDFKPHFHHLLTV